MKQTFAEKYNPVGKGHKIVISAQTKAAIERLNAEGRRVVDAGRDFVKNCTIRFGK